MKTRMGNFIVGAMLVILITGSIGYADLSTGLVAYYPFNGNALDESGNSNHGTLQGDASTVWDPGGNGKPAGWVLSLDGNGDYVRVPDSATILPTTKGTVATWFKTDPSMFRGWDGEYGLIAKMRYSSSPLGSEFEMRYSRYPYPTGDVLHCYLSDNTGWDRRYTYSSLDMADGVWHSLFVTWEAPVGEASYKMYLDGVAVGTYETANCSHQGIIEKSPPIPMYIGRRMHDSTPQWYWDFKGMMDEVRIYSRALSESEIQELAGSEPSPAEQIQEILDFVVESANGGRLAGTGNKPEKSIDQMIERLAKAWGYADAGLLDDAWIKLYEAFLRVDGKNNPPDLVQGTAASELREQILNVMEQLSPGWTFEFEADNALVYSVTTSFDDSRVAHALALGALKTGATKALVWIIKGAIVSPSPDPISIVAKIGIVAGLLEALSEEWDPVRVLPSAPNIEVKDGLYSAEIPADDPSYTAIVFLDFIGADWDDWMLDSISSDLSLESHSRIGFPTWERQPVLLSQADMKTKLTTEKSYIIVPKQMFNVNNIGWWPGTGDVILRASLRQHSNTRTDWRPLSLYPK